MRSLVGALLINAIEGCAVVPDGELNKRVSLNTLEQSVFRQVNDRQTLGLTALELNAQATQQGRGHSQAMAAGAVPFSHEGFEQRVKAIGSQVLFLSAAENVAYNHRV